MLIPELLTLLHMEMQGECFPPNVTVFMLGIKSFDLENVTQSHYSWADGWGSQWSELAKSSVMSGVRVSEGPS